MDVPGHPDTLFITDAAVNIFPDLLAKRDIVQNAIDLFVGLGLGTPKVAICRRLKPSRSIFHPLSRQQPFCKMADRGQITGGIVDGPLAFDNAISPEAARIKGNQVAGRRTRQYSSRSHLEAGNMLAKNLSFSPTPMPPESSWAHAFPLS